LYLFQDESEGAMISTDDIKLHISETAKELSQKLGAEVYMVIHITTCADLAVPIDKKLDKFTRAYSEGVTPQLITIKSEGKKVYTVLYYSLKEGFKKEYSSLLQSADNVNLQGVTKSSFLGYSAAPFDKVIECTNNLTGLSMYACSANDPNFLGFDTEERTVLYVDLLLTSIKACLEEQKNDKIGDQFYREFASKATTEQETKQIRQIADVFNKIGDALLKKNNTEGWAENGDYFRSSYEAYKQLGYSFDDYLTKITSYLSQYEQHKAFLEKLTDNESIALAINAFSDKEIEYLPLTLRVRCIGNLASERMKGNINLFGNNEEYAVLRLLKYLPEKDIKDLIGNLKNNTLLERLDSEYDDLEFFAGDENYGKLIDILDKYALSVNNVTDANKAATLENLYNQNRIYNITGGKVGEKYVSASKISSTGEIGITISSFEGYTEPVYTGEYSGFPMPIIKSQPPVNISFDSPVAVYYNDYLKGVDINKNGQLEVISTLKLHYYLSCNKNENVKTTISVVIDVGSLAVGAGAISGGVKGVRLILAVCDVASSVTSLATTAVEDKILKKYGSDGQKYINSMRAVSAVLGFADLGGQGVLKFKNLLKDDIVTIGKFYKQLEKDQEFEALYQQSKKLIDDVTAYDEEIELAIRNAGDLGGSLTHLDILINNLSDGLKAFANNYKKIGRVEEGADNIILFKNANNEVIGKITGNKFYLAHSGWGGDIAMNETRRTTILGKYNADKPGGTHSLLKSGIPNASLTGKVDFRILSSSEIDNLFVQAQDAINTGNYTLADELFEQAWEINRKWIDEGIANDDIIRLISEPISDNLMLTNHYGKRVLSFFGREKSYLESKGYVQQGFEFIKK
jgi:hypothetical protein